MFETARRPEFGDLARQFNRAMEHMLERQMCQFRAAETWAPAINAYRFERCIEICVDLAGVEKDTIDVRVEPGRLTLRGVRQAPQPECQPGQPVQILAMEIDHGPFERTFALPREVRVDEVTAEQTNGLLWLKLPLRRPRRHQPE